MRRVTSRMPALLLVVTYFPPVIGVAHATDWHVMWVFLVGFLVMACVTS